MREGLDEVPIVATATRTLMTATEFEAVAERLGPCELVRGEVVRLSPATLAQGLVTTNVAGLLWEWARRTRLGRVYAGETGLVVEIDPDTVRGADVVYYSYARLPKGEQPRGFGRTPPNLIVEVVGIGHGWRETLEKVGEYLGMGVDRVWVVDSGAQSVHIFRPDAEPMVLGTSDVLADDAVLPGFSCRVNDVFAD
jgi:Uma2 family endonuclease